MPSTTTPRNATLTQGQTLLAITKDARGNIVDGSQLWTIAEIDDTWITIRSDNGDEIKLRR